MLIKNNINGKELFQVLNMTFEPTHINNDFLNHSSGISTANLQCMLTGAFT